MRSCLSIDPYTPLFLRSRKGDQPMVAPPTLREYIAQLMRAEIVPRPDRETWDGLIARIHVTAKIAEIDEETFDWFLECLPPRYLTGGLFAFAEGAEALKLFWKKGGRFFVRPLTWDETKTFCKAAGMPLPQ